MKVARDSSGRFVKGKNKGKSHPRWKGGRKLCNGYVQVLMPDHPQNNRGYVLEHRLVMERSLGRYLLRGEVVHHKNGDIKDNRESNLELMTRHTHPANHLLGKKRPASVVEKVRKALMGHMVSPETRNKISLSKIRTWKLMRTV